MAGLLAVVLAYVGLALGGAASLSPAPTTSLSAVEIAAHRLHIAARDGAPTTVAVRDIDPPRAGWGGGGALRPQPQTLFVAGAAVVGSTRARDAALPRTPRAYASRAPPQAVRSAAA